MMPPIGPEVRTHEAGRPERTRIDGRDVALLPIDVAAHGPTLYALSHGPERDALWIYLWDGPYPSEGAFLDDLRRKAVSEDPFFYAIVDRATAEPIGYASFLRITPRDPANFDDAGRQRAPLAMPSVPMVVAPAP